MPNVREQMRSLGNLPSEKSLQADGSLEIYTLDDITNPGTGEVMKSIHDLIYLEINY